MTRSSTERNCCPSLWLWALTGGLITARPCCLYHQHVPSRTSGRGCWPRRLLVAVLAAVAALVLNAGCAESQTRPRSQSPALADSLVSVEIDDSPVSLPKTQLVTCVSVAPTGYLFSWTGSNQLVPRRPLDETETSSRVTVSFEIDPPEVKKLDVRLYFRGDELQIREPSDMSMGSMSITSSGPRRYVVVGMGRNHLSAQEPPRHLRIELQC